MRLTTVAILCALLAVTYLIGATLYVERIEQDIIHRSNAAIKPFQPEVTVQVNGRDVRLRGTVESENRRHDAGAQVAAVRGVRVTENLLAIQPAAFIFDALLSNATLTLSGSIHAVNTLEGLRKIAKHLQPGIQTHHSITLGAPRLPDAIGKVETGVLNLARLMEGQLHIDERVWQLRGLAADPLQRSEIEAAVAEQAKILSPLEVSVELDIHSLVSSDCRRHLQLKQHGASIQFESDSTSVKPEHIATLRHFARLPGICGGKLLVEAHADQNGSEAYNLRLSKRRAAAVKQHLIELGATAKSIHSFAYGEQRSLASSRSAVGKAVNRRVELHFIQSLDTIPLQNKPSVSVSLQSAE